MSGYKVNPILTGTTSVIQQLPVINTRSSEFLAGEAFNTRPDCIELCNAIIDTNNLQQEAVIFNDPQFLELNILAPTSFSMEEIISPLNLADKDKGLVSFVIYELASNALKFQLLQKPIDIMVALFNADQTKVLDVCINQETSSLAARERLFRNSNDFGMPDFYNIRKLGTHFENLGGGLFNTGELMKKTAVSLNYSIGTCGADYPIFTKCLISLDLLSFKAIIP